MIAFEKHVLDNGLRLLIHEDPATPLAVINLLYDVGARDESPDKTGFAHLFEHLMFEGSFNVPHFDQMLEKAGGSSNAYTNTDLTNYYDVLPANNLEMALYLESDRMLSLDFSQENLDNQISVVSEEYKQRYLNQPYGDVMLKFRPVVYKVHPYQWATIGKSIAHVQRAGLDDVKQFFFKYYRPNNAILSIAGGIKGKEVLPLVEKWFGDIEPSDLPARQLPHEPEQTEARELTLEADVPANAIYKVYHVCEQAHRDYYSYDLLTDILSTGQSARLYKELVKKQQLFTYIYSYLLGSIDPGMFVIEGKLVPGVKMEDAEAAISRELDKIRTGGIKERELTKVKNKVESSLLFARSNILSRAEKLAYFELLEDADSINKQVERYLSVSEQSIQDVVSKALIPQNCSTLYYLSKNN